MGSDLSFTPSLILDRGVGSSNAAFPLDLRVFTAGSGKREIYALRHRAFMVEGVITPRADGLFSDAYDELATSYNIGAFDAGACVGAFRLTFGIGRARQATMPCQELFGEVSGLEARGFRRVVEFTRMVVEPELTNTSFRTTLYATLIRAGIILAHAGRADYGLISVHPDKARFYEMMAGFRAMARAESYPGINAPAVLLGREFRALETKGARQNPFFKVSKAEIDRARQSLFAQVFEPAAVA